MADESQTLGWINIPKDGPQWKAGRYALTFGGWRGDDAQTVLLLDEMFTISAFPGHGGQRTGSSVIAAACRTLGATSVYPESPGPRDPNAVN